MWNVVQYPNAEITLTLTDELYFYKIVLARYGNDAFKLPFCADNEWETEKLMMAQNNEVEFELRDNNNNKWYGTMYKDVISDFYNIYCPRWSSCCRPFTKERDDFYRTVFYNKYFRQEVFDFFQKTGGSEAYYVDDQGESCGIMDKTKWDDIVNEINTNFKATTLKLSEYMMNHKFKTWTKSPFEI